MKLAVYLFSNYKIYLRAVLCVLSFIIVTVIFQNSYSPVYSLSTMLDNTTCRFIAYDDWNNENDSYIYLGQSIDVYIDDPESLLNVSVVQFMENETYTSDSMVNEKNTVLGQYSILDRNEISLPYSFKDKYKIGIGSNLFVDGTECSVKYFYRDIYQIHSIDTSLTEQAVFIGKGTVTCSKINYLKFNPSDETKHKELYSVDNSLRELIKKQKDTLLMWQIIIDTIMSVFFIGIIKEKEFLNSILRMRVNGDRLIFLKIMICELAYFSLPFLILLTISFWNKLSIFITIWGCSLIISLLLAVLTNFTIVWRKRINE